MNKVYALRFVPNTKPVNDIKAEYAAEGKAMTQDEEREFYVHDMLAKVTCDNFGEVLFEDVDVVNTTADRFMDEFSALHKADKLLEKVVTEREVN